MHGDNDANYPTIHASQRIQDQRETQRWMDVVSPEQLPQRGDVGSRDIKVYKDVPSVTMQLQNELAAPARTACSKTRQRTVTRKRGPFGRHNCSSQDGMRASMCQRRSERNQPSRNNHSHRLSGLLSLDELLCTGPKAFRESVSEVAPFTNTVERQTTATRLQSQDRVQVVRNTYARRMSNKRRRTSPDFRVVEAHANKKGFPASLPKVFVSSESLDMFGLDGAQGSQSSVFPIGVIRTTVHRQSMKTAKTIILRSVKNTWTSTHGLVFKQSPRLQAPQSNSLFSEIVSSPGPANGASEDVDGKANDGGSDEKSGQDAEEQHESPPTQKDPSQPNSKAKENSDPNQPSDSEHESDSESGSESEEGMKNVEKNVHVPLSYQIPSDTLLTAMQALPNTRGSFWSHQLYRGPNEEKISVHYCIKLNVAERVAKYFLDAKAIGFDMEWKPYGWPTSIKQNASLIQIACEDRIALFHIALFTGNTLAQLVPPSLKIILESPDIYKVGVNIKGDFTRLERHLGIQARGVLELSRIHNLVERPEAGHRLCKLSTQVQQHLLLPLYKGEVLADEVAHETEGSVTERTTKEDGSGSMTESTANEDESGSTTETTTNEAEKRSSGGIANESETASTAEAVGNEVENESTAEGLAKENEVTTKTTNSSGSVRESDWSRAIDREQIHYAAADAYAGFRLYDVLESKRKKMKPVPPLPRLCDNDPVGRPSAPRRPRTTKPKVDATPVVSKIEEVSEDSQEYETALEEMEDDSDGEDSNTDSSSGESQSSNEAPDADYVPRRLDRLSLDEAGEGVTNRRLPSRRIGRVRIARLTEAAAGDLAFPASLAEESDSDESDAFDPAPPARPRPSNLQTLPAHDSDEFADSDLEDALMNMNVDHPSQEGKASDSTTVVDGTELIQEEHEILIHQELSATDTTVNDSQPGDINLGSIDAPQSTDPIHTPTFTSLIPTPNSNTPEYTAATSWAQSYLHNTIPTPSSPSSRPAGIRATTSHLRAYYLWHHLRIPLSEIGSHLKDPPLAQSTVSSHILQAVSLEKLDCEDGMLREVLAGRSEGMRVGRWGALWRRVGGGS